MGIFDDLKSGKYRAASAEPEPLKDRSGKKNRLQPAPRPVREFEEERHPYLANVGKPLLPVEPYQRPARGPDGKILPGHSGNPTGGPRGIVALIHALTGGGEELMVHALLVMRGGLTVTKVDKDGNPFDVGPDFKDQAEARAFLANRLLGKAPETIKIEDAREDDNAAELLGSMTPDELRTFYRLYRKPAFAPTVDAKATVRREDPPEPSGAVPGDAPAGDPGADPR